jgi:hypothetical protein
MTTDCQGANVGDVSGGRQVVSAVLWVDMPLSYGYVAEVSGVESDRMPVEFSRLVWPRYPPHATQKKIIIEADRQVIEWLYGG